MKKIFSLILGIVLLSQNFVAAEAKLTNSQGSIDDYNAHFLSEYVSGVRRYIPVYPKTNEIILDGDVSDWKNYEAIEAKRIKAYNSSAIDATLHIKYTYDEEKFYLLAVVKDDIWHTVPAGSYWSADCLQLGFTTFDAKNFRSEDNEYGVSYDQSEKKPYLTHPDLTDASITRTNDSIIYELAFSWEKMFGERPDKFLFCIIAGDNDGSGRKYCVELSDGISEGKTNVEFPCMILCSESDDENSFMFVQGPNQGETHTTQDYSVNIYNPGEERKFNISSKFLEIDEEITVPAESFITKVYSHNYLDKRGSYTVDISSDEDIPVFETDVYINPTLDFYEDKLNELSERIKEIKGLIAECENQGIPTDYENINLTVMESFSKNIPSDLKIKHTEHIDYNFEALDEVYHDAKDRLTAYLMGSDKPEHATRVSVDKPVDIKGNTFWGYTTTNGVEEYRPIYLQGYGHFSRVGTNADLMYNLGANYIVTELGPSECMVATGEYPYWTGITSNENRKREISVQSEEAYSGKKALKIVNGHALTANVYGRVSQKLLIKPNTKYKFGGMIKAKKATGLKLTMNDWSDYHTLPQNTDGWEKFEFEFTPTNQYRYSTVFALITEDLCEECYLDDLYIYEEGTDKNLLKNSSFEDTPDQYGDMIMDYNETFAWWIYRLNNAQKNNLKVGVNLAPHYYPKYMDTINPAGRVASPGFNTFRTDDERTRKVLETHIINLLEEIKDYTCVVDICLQNEPVYSANANDCYKPHWANYLQTVYDNDINLLNKCYGTEYTSFEEVDMPTKKDTSVRSYDYAKFNNAYLTEFTQWMAEVVRKVRPDLPVHAKLMPDMQGTHTDRTRAFYFYGYTWEDFAKVTDVIGYDGGATHKPTEFLKDTFVESTQLVQWFKTDFITSLKNVPWINSETHIIGDNSFDFSMDDADHIGRYMWQEGIHGLGGSAIWVFDDRARDPTFQGSVYYRPAVQLAVGRSTLDLNRLSYEVSSVSNAERNIGLVYSYSARNYNDILDNNMVSIYSAITFNGLKTKFISDRQPQDLTTDIDLLFVPNAIHVMPEILDAIIEYQDNGGKVVIFGNDSLTKDERNLPQDAEKIEKIYSRADVIPVTGDGYLVTSPRLYETQTIVDGYIDKFNLRPVVVVDANTGEMVKEIEWEYNVYNGKLLVNVCSYRDYQDQTDINIYINGKKVDRFKELRSGETYSGTVTVVPSTPLLLQMDIENPFVDTYGHWAEEEILSLHNEGVIYGKTEAKFDPQGTLTYAEWITLIARQFGLETVQTDDEHWSAPYVEAAKNAGIISGKIDYDKAISRADMCKIIVTALEKVKGMSLKTGEITFADSTECDVNVISKAVNAGIINGYEDNTFRPNGKLTRAEAARVLSDI